MNQFDYAPRHPKGWLRTTLLRALRTGPKHYIELTKILYEENTRDTQHKCQSLLSYLRKENLVEPDGKGVWRSTEHGSKVGLKIVEPPSSQSDLKMVSDIVPTTSLEAFLHKELETERELVKLLASKLQSKFVTTADDKSFDALELIVQIKDKRQRIEAGTKWVFDACRLFGCTLSTSYTVSGLFSAELERELLK